MELTQKLEYTQEICSNKHEKEFPEQIGFLGICGVKYPLKKGPNKIGRDPDTCNIVLNLNSISRQHAVINILNSYDFMLMDLDSANKTKIADKTLQAYIPHPIKNGDMVQFGQVFGVFRLFEEDNDLPMTQALDVPETPVRNHLISKVNLITTIPESPEVSDRDDSFIVASQPKSKNVFKSPSTNFIKSSGKSVAIKPVGYNKIDNAYWSSSRKSDSFSLESDTSKNDSDLCLKTNKITPNIHEQDTQCMGYNKTDNSIYEADTQAETVQTSVHSMDTQLPEVNNLPEVFKVQGQENINLDLSTENKENEDVYNSETQEVLQKGDDTTTTSVKDNDEIVNKDVSDDVILFDEIDSPIAEDNFESQPLMMPELEAEQVDEKEESENLSKEGEKPPNRRNSGSSTDCEDIYIALTQNLPEKRIDNDETDCEDDQEMPHKVNKIHKIVDNSNIDDDLTDCEDEFENKSKTDPGLEDLATQIIDNASHCEINSSKTLQGNQNHQNEITKDEIDLEDMPTQIISYEPQNVYSEEVVTPFKVPAISPLKRRKKEQEAKAIKIINNKNIAADIDIDDEENYYDATQELLNDLCTQSAPSALTSGANIDVIKTQSNKTATNPPDCREVCDIDEKINRFVMDLTNMDKDSTINLDKSVGDKKTSSDSSDVETTPRKLNPLSFLNVELPNTQEIKRYVKATGETSPDTSLDLDTDGSDCERQKKKKNTRSKNFKRENLINRLESEKSPERITPITNETQHFNVDIDSKKLKKNIKSLLLDNENNNNRKAVVANASKHEERSKRSTRSDNANKKQNKESNKSKESSKKIKENIAQEHKEKSNRSTRGSDKSDKKESKESNRGKETSKEIKEDIVQEKSNSKGTVTRGRKNNITVENQNIKQNTKDDIKSNATATGGDKIKENSSKKSTDNNDKEKRNSRSTTKQIASESHESKPLQTQGNSNRNSRSKRNRKETNTIDKFLSPVIKAQKEIDSNDKEQPSKRKEIESKSIEKESKENKSTDKRSRNSDKTRNKDKEVESTEEKRTRSKTKSSEIENKESSQSEVRRSKRQRIPKKSFEMESKRTKNHEQSTVYNISSESGIDSPNKLKRQASDLSLPSSKKTKICNSSIAQRDTSNRKIKTQYVLFTAFPCDEVKFKLEKLGAVVVTDITQCTVVLTLEIKRTFKLLCAVGLGKPIVGPNWVQACVDTNMIVDPWSYLIKDEKTEKRFQFNLERILRGKREFLKGYNVSTTPNVMPSPPEMKLIVECSGGTWTVGGKNWICVSSNTDRNLWAGLKSKGAIIVSTEFVLAGVLRQKIDIKRNILL